MHGMNCLRMHAVAPYHSLRIQYEYCGCLPAECYLCLSGAWLLHEARSAWRMIVSPPALYHFVAETTHKIWYQVPNRKYSDYRDSELRYRFPAESTTGESIAAL